MTVNLGKFEGADVQSVGIEIPAAGGGLNAPMGVDPVVLHRGQVIDVVLRVEVGKIRFDPIKDSQGVKRVHVMTVHEAAIIDSDVVSEALEEQRRRIEEAQGIQQLEFEQAEAAAEAAAGAPKGKRGKGRAADSDPVAEQQVKDIAERRAQNAADAAE